MNQWIKLFKAVINVLIYKYINFNLNFFTVCKSCICLCCVTAASYKLFPGVQRERETPVSFIQRFAFKQGVTGELVNVKIHPSVWFAGWTPMNVSLWVMSPQLTWRWWKGVWLTMWFQQKWTSALTWESHPLLTCRCVSGPLHGTWFLLFMKLICFELIVTSSSVYSAGVWREDKSLVQRSWWRRDIWFCTG